MSRPRTPHIIDLDEMLKHLRTERWDQYASADHELGRKRLEVLMSGLGFRVTVGDIEIYRGQNASDAVRAYNAA